MQRAVDSRRPECGESVGLEIDCRAVPRYGLRVKPFAMMRYMHTTDNRR